MINQVWKTIGAHYLINANIQWVIEVLIVHSLDTALLNIEITTVAFLNLTLWKHSYTVQLIEVDSLLANCHLLNW